uniref:Uncharacterized protein n=1 Tax=Arundo donax TaxID=35708 RepID=A0A0A9C158_ARUDO
MRKEICVLDVLLCLKKRKGEAAVAIIILMV